MSETSTPTDVFPKWVHSVRPFMIATCFCMQLSTVILGFAILLICFECMRVGYLARHVVAYSHFVALRLTSYILSHVLVVGSVMCIIQFGRGKEAKLKISNVMCVFFIQLVAFEAFIFSSYDYQAKSQLSHRKMYFASTFLIGFATVIFIYLYCCYVWRLRYYPETMTEAKC